jgi:dihydroorotase
MEKIKQDALKGGVTTVTLMPDVAVNSEVGFDYFASKAVGAPSIKIAASTTENNAKEKLNNLSLVFHEGAIGVHSPTDLSSDFLRCTSRYASMHNLTWFIRAQNSILDTSAQMNEGKVASSLGLTGFTRLSEASEVAKICEYARDANANIVIESISSKEAYSSALRAKNSGVKAYMQASLPYLLLDDSICNDFNSYAKIYPPLREEEDKNILINGCINGEIDAVSSSHRPVKVSKKEVSFDEASFGIESLANFWPLAYSALKDKISIEKICKLVSSNPSKILGLNDRGFIEVGMRADLVLFNPTATQENCNDKKNIYSKLKIEGKVVQTISAESAVW